MKKHVILLLSCIFVAITVSTLSCMQNKSDSNKAESAKSEENMNENIQSTFFGATFGDSREQVIDSLTKHGFWLNTNYSNNTFLTFRSTKSESFSFGNMSWGYINIYLNNNKFYYISFYSDYKEKESAKNKYETILEEISKKYKIAPEEPSDTTTYALQRGYDKNNRRISVYYDQEEATNHSLNYYSFLTYKDLNIEEEASDEL